MDMDKYSASILMEYVTVCVWGGGKSDAMTVHAALCV